MLMQLGFRKRLDRIKRKRLRFWYSNIRDGISILIGIIREASEKGTLGMESGKRGKIITIFLRLITRARIYSPQRKHHPGAAYQTGAYCYNVKPRHGGCEEPLATLEYFGNPSTRAEENTSLY